MEPQSEFQRTASLRDSRLPPESPSTVERDRRGVPPVFWGLLFGCGPWLLLLMFVLFMIVIGASRSGRGAATGPSIGLIHVSGVITSGAGGGSPLSGSASAGSEDLVEKLEKAYKEEEIKAVVLRINSPGGSPVGSQEVWEEIRKVKRKKPVIVSMGDVAASGATTSRVPPTASSPGAAP